MKYISNEELGKIIAKSEMYNGGIMYVELTPGTDTEGTPIYKSEGTINMPNVEAMTSIVAHIVNDYVAHSGLKEEDALKNLFEVMVNMK